VRQKTHNCTILHCIAFWKGGTSVSDGPVRGHPEHSQILDSPYRDLGAGRIQKGFSGGCEVVGEAAGEGVASMEIFSAENGEIRSKRLHIVVDPFFQALVNAIQVLYPLRHTFPVQLKSITMMYHMAEFPVGRQVGRKGFVKENRQRREGGEVIGEPSLFSRCFE